MPSGGREQLASTRELLTRFPDWLRERIRVLEVDRPGRAVPLNQGFAAARGRYMVILDDDDTVLGHWVETFAKLEEQAAGRMLRAVAIRQDVLALPAREDVCPVSVGEAFRDWPLTFELIDHLRGNYSPCMTIAFPRGLFHDLGFRFDETLNTTEDWEFIVRGAAMVGVESAPEVTSVYRWWLDQHSSREAHSKDEWDSARDRILDRFDNQVMLMPPSALHRIRGLLDEAFKEAQELATSQHEVILDLNAAQAAHDKAVELWHAAEEREQIHRQRATDYRAKLDERRKREHARRDLMREADLLLMASSSPRERSIADMSMRELRELVAELTGAPQRRTWRSVLGRET